MACRVRELGRPADPAVHRIAVLGEEARRLGRHVLSIRYLAAEETSLNLPVTTQKLFHSLAELVALALPRLAKSEQKAHESWPSGTIPDREVRPAEERFTPRGHEDRQRPAPALPHHLSHFLVDVIDVGALLAVDLDVDKTLVHDAGDVWVLERLVRHDVAPMARGVPNRQVDGLVLLSGSVKCLFSPRIPIDRVLGVLPEIRGRFLSQSIRHRVLSTSRPQRLG